MARMVGEHDVRTGNGSEHYPALISMFRDHHVVELVLTLIFRGDRLGSDPCKKKWDNSDRASLPKM